MKKILIILLVLCLSIPMVSANTLDVQDNYLANDTVQLESRIPIAQEIQSHIVDSYIDNSEEDTYISGGISFDCDTNSYNYVLPHNLGLGQHTLMILFDDGNIEEYNFSIIMNRNDDASIYEYFTPYTYDTDLDNLSIIEEDYNGMRYIHENGTEEIDENNDVSIQDDGTYSGNHYIIEPNNNIIYVYEDSAEEPDDINPFVLVNLGNIKMIQNDNLIEIDGDL